MKIEAWSDFLCPYAYFSTKSLEKAIKKFGNEDKIQYIHRGSQLVPRLVRKEGQGHIEWTAEIFDMTIKEAEKALWKSNGKRAEEAGIPFHPEKALPVDTTILHYLVFEAEEKNLTFKAVIRFFDAYYQYGEDLANIDVLKSIVKEIGLDEDIVDFQNLEEKHKKRFRGDIREFRKRKYKSVPHYLFNDEEEPNSKDPSEFLDLFKKYGE